MLTPGDIKSLRSRLRESQAVFGERFGVDQTTVHRWETNGLPDRGAARTAVERFANEMPVPAAEQMQATQ